MKKSTLFFFSLLFSLLTSCNNTPGNMENAASSTTTSETEGPTALKEPFVHTVFFWLKEPQNAEARKKFEASLRNFIQHSQYVRSMHIGTPAPTNRPVIDNTYTYCLVATFASEADQAAYQAEPVHKKFIEESEALWERVQVYDSIAF